MTERTRSYDALRERRQSEGIEPTTLIVKTYVPEKYLLVDRETGQTWRWGDKGHWVNAGRVAVHFEDANG